MVWGFTLIHFNLIIDLSQMIINYKSNYNCEMRVNYDHMENINSYIRIRFAIRRFYHDSKSNFLGNFNFGWLCGRLFRQKISFR